VDASEKDVLLDLVKSVGGRFTERHSHHGGRLVLTHVTVEPFTFKVVYPETIQEKPGRSRKQEGKL
jgi:hypothetical protein